MTKLLTQAYDPDEFRKNAHQLVDLIADHLSFCLNRQVPQVISWREPLDLREKWKQNLDRKMGNDQMWAETIKDTHHLHHPRFMGHQNSPAIPAAGLGDLINGALNNGTAIYEMGPVSSVMERIVIEWLAEAMGFGEGFGGILTSGGSLGNFTAMLAARQVMAGYDIWKEGMREDFKPAIMVSEEAHYSVARSVQMMGWGEEAIIKVPVNKKHQLDSSKLEESRLRALNLGRTPLILVANACSTSTGSYDPLEAMADFAEKHHLWYHIDGAHGGAAAITPKYRHLTKGINRADTVVIDFHKMMGVSGLTTALLFKDRAHSYETFNQQASYLLNASGEDPWYDSALRTVECTKNMMGIKVYTILKAYGPQFFIDYLTTCYDLGSSFAGIIQQSSDFQLAVEPESNIVCFRFHPEHLDENGLNDLNGRIRETLLKAGEFYIVQTRIEGQLWLRVSIMNPFTQLEDFNNLLIEIRKIAKTLSS